MSKRVLVVAGLVFCLAVVCFLVQKAMAQGAATASQAVEKLIMLERNHSFPMNGEEAIGGDKTLQALLNQGWKVKMIEAVVNKDGLAGYAVLTRE